MPYQTLQEFQQTTNSSDLTTIFAYDASIVQYFSSIVILFPLFVVVLLSTFFIQKRTIGRGDFWASFVSAGFVNLIVALLLSLTTPALVDVGTLIICIGIFIVGVIILFLTRE